MEDLKMENRGGITYLSGKVDSTNAPAFEEELRGIKDEYLILDLSDLSYISSAGLRVLLKIAKEKKDHFKLVNVPDEVYEVFEMTGFTSILNIEKKRRSISIEGCDQIAQGATGKVYRLDDETIVKVFNAGVTDELISRELECSHQALIAGIPTAIAFDVVDVGGSRGIVYELLSSKTLAQELMDHPESFDELMEKLVTLLKQIHSTKVDSKLFPRISETYHGYLDFTRKWLTEEEADKLRRMIDSIPERDTLVHGDFHAKNIMVVKGELTLIDMADTSIGNPFYDIMGVASAYCQLPKSKPEACMQYVGMAAEMTSKVWQRILELYFDDATAEERDEISRCFQDYMTLKFVFAPALGAVQGEASIQALIGRARERMIPQIDEQLKNDGILWRYF